VLFYLEKNMDAVVAGLLAWFIEVTIAVSMFAILRHEEKKVYKRRKDVITRSKTKAKD
tara:strand:- start:1832 stop:2005 length:174 start_codon:yes stop_codon:yes gene_type:complete